MQAAKQRVKLSEVLPHGLKTELAAKLKVAPGNIPGILDTWNSERSRIARIMAIELAAAHYREALEILEEYQQLLAPNGADVAQ